MGGGRGGGMGGFPETSEGEKVVDAMRNRLDRLKRGLVDAARLDRSWSLVWG